MTSLLNPLLFMFLLNLPADNTGAVQFALVVIRANCTYSCRDTNRYRNVERYFMLRSNVWLKLQLRVQYHHLVGKVVNYRFIQPLTKLLFQVFLSTENVEDVHENLPVSCFKLCAIVDILSSQSSDMMTRICSKQSDHRAVVVLLRSCFKYRLCRCAAVPPPAFAAPAVSRRTRGSCARGVK